MQTDMFTSATLAQNNERVLHELYERCVGCTGCKLHTTRTQVVFGAGNTKSPAVAFVGEAPGAVEDRLGLPFQGASGELLNRMIAKMGLKREDLYILNTVNCRPPDNRPPEPDEIMACMSYMHGQLRLVQPKVIVTLGATATHTLLKKDKPLGDLRGKWHKWESIPVRPTYHPSYLLRNPKERATTLVDLEAVLTLLRTLANTAKS